MYVTKRVTQMQSNDCVYLNKEKDDSQRLEIYIS